MILDGPTIAIDFETYYASGYSVADLGNYAYTHDPRFDAYLVALHDGSNTWVGHPRDFDWSLLAGKQLVSHNAEFDRHVYERLVELGVAPSAPFASWLCSAACCAYLQLPRDLAGAAQAVFGVILDKRQRAAARGKAPEAELTNNQAMLDYAAEDARWCFRLWQELSPFWPAHERELYCLTCRAGRYGLPVDSAYLKQACGELSRAISEAEQEVPWRPLMSPKSLLTFCRQCGVPEPTSTAASSPDFQAWLERHDQTRPAQAAQAVGRVRSLNRTIKVLEAIQRRTKPDGRCAYQLKYAGAGPGRWSGDAGLNVQNLNRGEIHGVSLRRVFACPPGRTFAIVDFAQIEARVLLWLVGDTATLELIRSGVDLYEAHARATMGYADPRPLKEVAPGMRQLAKARVLGLGYGCGHKRFIEVARSMAGLEISEQESRKCVRAYRQANPGVTDLWRRLELAFKDCHGRNYNLSLPSGRFLIYRDVDATTGDATIGGERENFYGGRLTENLVQATARDLLASAWLRCARAGYEPLLNVHDELVFELDETTAQSDLERIAQLMSVTPAWAKGCPLEADGKLSREYCK